MTSSQFIVRPHPTAPGSGVRGVLLAVGLGCAIASAHANVLELLRDAPEGGWLRANQNFISNVWTPPSLRNDWTVQGGEMERIIFAWSSFAWDSNRSSLIIYGGGHANYGSNDVYTWNGNTLRWQRSSLPSKVDLRPALGYNYGFAADGSMNAPASAHTYDNTVFLRAADRYMTLGGAAFNNGGAYIKDNGNGGFTTTGPYLFDPSRADGNKVGGTTGSGVNPSTLGGRMWQNRDTLGPAPPGVLKPKSFIDGISDSTVVDGRDVVYFGGAQDGTAMDLYRYTIYDVNDPLLDTLEYVGTNANPVSTGDSAGALDSERGLFVRTGDASKPFLVWDVSRSGLDNRDRVVRPIDLSGGLAPTNFRGYGFAYDPVRKRFVVWGGGANVWALTPPEADFETGAWTIDRLSVASPTAPGPLNTIGVLGKWQYAADLDAFVALQGPSTGDVWIYKPEGWSDAAMIAIPEPGTYAMLVLGLVGISARLRRRSTH